MNSAYVWGFSLPFAVFVISVGLFLFALLKKWPVEIASTDLPDEPVENAQEVKQSPIKERIIFFVEKYRWELILGAAIGIIILFALIFAPPRSNGYISIYPGTPGRPFYSLRWVRAFLNTYDDAILTWSTTSFSLLCLILFMWVLRKRSGLGAQFLMLGSSLNLAGAGQWFLREEASLISGKTLYLFALCGFGLWAWAARKRLVNDLKYNWGVHRFERVLLLGLLLLASFSRLYALRTIPYGIEGDEAKWTSEAVNLGIRGVPDPSGEYHRDALPVSFYIQIPFHRVLGPSLFAARLTVVLLSIAGTLVFYGLLRQIAVVPVAAIAAYLLSISIFDISASRLANVESFVKVWPILGLALLAMAVRLQRWQIYSLSGLAIALGMLTYDTAWPLFVIVLMIATIELARQRKNKQESMKSMAALLAPILLTLPVLIPYMVSRLSYYGFERKGLFHDSGSTLAEFFGTVIHTWFVAGASDFLYNRPGPLLNALLLPLLALGFVSALFLINKQISYWTLLWAGLVIFPVPILAHSPLGRVYYPALPAVYILVALGIYFFWNESNRFFGLNFKPVLNAVALVSLLWLALANLYIYFNEVYDTDDRLKRREIGEMAVQAAAENTLILLPATPGANTPLYNEHQMLELYMLQKIRSKEIQSAYDYVAPEKLLSKIESEAENYQQIEIIFDKTVTEFLTSTLKLCYPQGRLTEGEFFNRFSLSNDTLR